jgi:hypothetical protein
LKESLENSKKTKNRKVIAASVVAGTGLLGYGYYIRSKKQSPLLPTSPESTTIKQLKKLALMTALPTEDSEDGYE